MKKIITLMTLSLFIFVSCQKDSKEDKISKGKEIDELENMYGIQFQEISEDESKKFLYIPFETLKEYLEQSHISRNGTKGDYRGEATWKSYNQLDIQVKDVSIHFDIPYKFKITFSLLGGSLSAGFNFKDAILEHGLDIFKLRKKSDTWHKVPGSNRYIATGEFEVNFTTNVGGKSYKLYGNLSTNADIHMGSDVPSINTTFMVQVGIQVTF